MRTAPDGQAFFFHASKNGHPNPCILITGALNQTAPDPFTRKYFSSGKNYFPAVAFSPDNRWMAAIYPPTASKNFFDAPPPIYIFDRAALKHGTPFFEASIKPSCFTGKYYDQMHFSQKRDRLFLLNKSDNKIERHDFTIA